MCCQGFAYTGGLVVQGVTRDSHRWHFFCGLRSAGSRAANEVLCVSSLGHGRAVINALVCTTIKETPPSLPSSPPSVPTYTYSHPPFFLFFFMVGRSKNMKVWKFENQVWLLKNVFLAFRKSGQSKKCFSTWASSIFLTVVSTICGTVVKNMWGKGPGLDFLGSESGPSPALLTIRRDILDRQVCCRCLCSCLCLSRVPWSVGLPPLWYLKKPPSTATQAFSLRTHAVPIFSNFQRLLVHVL